MEPIVLDTNIILALANEEADKDIHAIEDILHNVSAGRVEAFVSSLTLAEIYAVYTRKAEQRKAVEVEIFLDEIGIKISDATREICKLGGFLKGKYHRLDLSYADCIIASTAVINGVKIVVTYDPEFPIMEEIIPLKPEDFVRK